MTSESEAIVSCGSVRLTLESNIDLSAVQPNPRSNRKCRIVGRRIASMRGITVEVTLGLVAANPGNEKAPMRLASGQMELALAIAEPVPQGSPRRGLPDLLL